MCQNPASHLRFAIINLGGNKEPYDIYIGRANKYLGLPQSKWANPFVMKNESEREEVLRKYKEHVLSRKDLMDSLPELEGKILACWCWPRRCHGLILNELLELKLKGEL